MGMNDLTTEEFMELDIHKQRFYLENREFMDFRFKDGQLCMVSYPEPVVSWERFMELTRLVMFSEYQRTEAVPHIELSSDFEDWNKFGRPYLEHGLEFSLTLRCCGLDRGDKAARAAASRQLLTDFLMGHGGTDDELKGISWNGSSYSAHFRCPFTNCPPEVLPDKVKRWVRKNPDCACLVYA